MKLIVISGRSGSGKSTALNVLEDCGFTCIDNLPVGLVPELIDNVLAQPHKNSAGLAVCIDARSLYGDMTKLSAVLVTLPSEIDSSLVYMDADDDILLVRFSETRRKHPLSTPETALVEALKAETVLLESLAENANITIDSSDMAYHDLRDIVTRTIADREHQDMAVLIQSFGFKYGVPKNADLMFDVRCLPNPHWEPTLKPLPGTDPAVQKYILDHAETQAMLADIERFILRWLPEYERTNRQYSTIAIGCTGGRHRSVCIAEALQAACVKHFKNTAVRHRDLHLTKSKNDWYWTSHC